jgi:hypothetical protein
MTRNVTNNTIALSLSRTQPRWHSMKFIYQTGVNRLIMTQRLPSQRAHWKACGPRAIGVTIQKCTRENALSVYKTGCLELPYEDGTQPNHLSRGLESRDGEHVAIKLNGMYLY